MAQPLQASTDYVNFSGNRILAKMSSNITPDNKGFIVSYTDSNPSILSNDFIVTIPSITSACFDVASGQAHCYVRAFSQDGATIYYGYTIDAWALPRPYRDVYTLKYYSCGSYTFSGYAYWILDGIIQLNKSIGNCTNETGAECDNIIMFYNVGSDNFGINTDGDNFTLSGTITTAAPTVNTSVVTSITSVGGYFCNNLVSIGIGTLYNNGLDISTNNPPTYKFNGAESLGAHCQTVNDLQPNTLYYYRAWAWNGNLDAHGVTYSFTTHGIPTVTTTTISSITQTDATGGGNVTNNGGETVTARGICWNTSTNPTTADTKTIDGSGTGAFVSSITGLSANTTYYVRAYAINTYGTSYGSNVSFLTDTIPTVTTAAITYVSPSSTAGGGNVTDDGGDTVSARGTCWNTSGTPTTADTKTIDGSGTGAFVSNITGLNYNQTYYYRAYATNQWGTAYGNEIEYLVFEAPTGLVITSIGDTQVCLSWVNNSNNDDITVFSKKESEGWLEFETVPTGTTTSCVTGLSMNTFYTFRVENNAGVESLSSNTVNATTTFSPLPPFCESEINYNLSGSTCGNSDGQITINNEDYTIFYDFVLTDIDGNIMPFTDYWWSGLTAGYYFLVATVKPEYWSMIGRDACNFDWIIIEDTDTPLVLDGVSKRPAQCQSFDVVSGRIWYNVTGLTSGHTYSFNAWDANKNVMASQTGLTSTEEFLLDNLSAGCYYAVIYDEISECHLVLDIQCIQALAQFSMGGIKHCWIAPWSDYLEFNYWTSTDDDYFLEFADTSFFFSTKIKEYLLTTGGTIQWYSLPVAPQVAKLSQTLNKVSQGYIFEDTLEIAIAKGNASKWTAMATILNPDNKWIGIVQDADGFYWTFGYRHGARIAAYNFKTGARQEDNGYLLTFSAQSENKIMTNIDSAYVKNYVI